MAYETDSYSTVHPYPHPQSVEVCLGSEGSGQRQRQSISSSFFPKTVSCILGWPQPCYATEDDLEYLIPPPPCLHLLVLRL